MHRSVQGTSLFLQERIAIPRQQMRKVCLIWQRILVRTCWWTSRKCSFGCLVHLIRALHENLSKKLDGNTSRTDTVLRSVFLLNNVNYLLKRLEKSDWIFLIESFEFNWFSSSLLALIQRCQPDLKTKYENDLQTSLRDFTKWYSTLFSFYRILFSFFQLQPIDSRHSRNAGIR